MNRQKIGVQYNKPKNVFQTILEYPYHPEMIYCSTVEQAQRILMNMKKQALDAIEKEFELEHRKIIRLGEEMK